MSDYDYGRYDDSLPLFADCSDEPSLLHDTTRTPSHESLMNEFILQLQARKMPSTASEIASGSDATIRDKVREAAYACVAVGSVEAIGSKRCDVTGEIAAVYWVR